MKSWRRYEILLPRRLNDGKLVPKALLAQTVLELEDRFGAVSCETQIIHGRWSSQGPGLPRRLDAGVRGCRGDPEVQAFFANFKHMAKARFQQLDIWLTSHSIEVL